MSVPFAWVAQRNVNLSILKMLEDRIALQPPYDPASAPPYGRFFWQDALADPTELNEPNGDPLAYWLEVNVIDGGVLRKVPTIVQIDVYYRVGDRSQATGDRFGHMISGVVDDLQERMVPLNKGFSMYEFNADASLVQRIPPWLQLRNTAGVNGAFSSRRSAGITNGLRRTALTLDVWHVLDLSRDQPYIVGTS